MEAAIHPLTDFVNDVFCGLFRVEICSLLEIGIHCKAFESNLLWNLVCNLTETKNIFQTFFQIFFKSRYLVVTSCYWIVTSCYLVAISRCLLFTIGYFSLVLVTSGYLWLLTCSTFWHQRQESWINDFPTLQPSWRHKFSNIIKEMVIAVQMKD